MQNIADHVLTVAIQVPQAEQGVGTAAPGGILQAGAGQVPLPASNAATRGAGGGGHQRYAAHCSEDEPQRWGQSKPFKRAYSERSSALHQSGRPSKNTAGGKRASGSDVVAQLEASCVPRQKLKWPLTHAAAPAGQVPSGIQDVEAAVRDLGLLQHAAKVAAATPRRPGERPPGAGTASVPTHIADLYPGQAPILGPDLAGEPA